MGARRFTRSFIWVLFGATTAIAAPGEVKELTLQRSIQQALERNPEIRLKVERMEEAQARVSSSLSQFFPTLQASAGLAYRKDPLNLGNPLFGGEPYNNYVLELKAVQPIFNGLASWYSASSERKERTIRELEYETAARSLTAEVVSAYYRVLFSRRKIKTLQEAKKVQQESQTTTEARIRTGRSQLIDSLQIKTEIASLDARLSAAQKELNLATTYLANQIGEKDASAFEFGAELETPNPAVIATLAEAKLKQKEYRFPELEKAELARDQMSDIKSAALAPNWPQVNAYATWGRSSYVKAELLDSFSTSWNAGVQLTVPIFSGLSSFFERQRLSSLQRQTEIEQTRVADQLALNQIQSKKQLDSARTVLEKSTEASDLSRKTLEEARKQYRFQLIDYLRMLQIQQKHLETELSFDQARLDYVVSATQYFTASGFKLNELVTALEPPAHGVSPRGKSL